MESIEELSLLFLSRHPREAAVSLEKLPPKEAVKFLQDIGTDKAGQVLVYLSPEKARRVFEKFPAKLQTEILGYLPVNNGALLLRKVNSKQQSKIIKGLSQDKQKQLNLLLFYEKGTAGAAMDPNPLAFVEDQPIADCIEAVKRTHTSRPLFYFYILDRRGNVTGQCNLHDMLKNKGQDIIIGQIKRPVKFLISGHSEIKNLLNNEELSRYGSLPVIDESGLFIGAIYQNNLVAEGGEVREGAFNATSNALGEVFLLGFSGVFQSFDNQKQ